MVNKQPMTNRNKDIHNHATRQGDDFHSIAYNKISIKKDPSVAGKIFFNKLPSNLKVTSHTKEFKTNLKKYLIQKCIYNINDL